MSDTRTEGSDPSANSNYRWYVLGLLTVVSMFSIADRLVFSILLEDIKAEFAFSDFQIGLLGGLAFAATYVIIGFPAARLADRSVRKNIVAGAISFWSVMTALCGLATGFWTLFFARTGVGVGEGCSGPASQSLVSDYFPRHELAKAMGYLTLGATMGTAGGLIVGGQLNELFGWRYAFILMGLPGVLIGLMMYLTVREPKRGRFAPPSATIEQQPLGETLKELIANRVFMGLAIGWAVQIMIGYALAFWMAAVMLRNFDISTGDVGLYLGLAFLIGGIPGPVLGGYVAEWLTRRDERWRAWLPGAVSLGCVIPLAISLQSGAFWPFLIWFAIAYAIYVASQAPILSGIQAAVEPSQRGFAVAVALFFNNLVGQAAGLSIIGAISDQLTPVYGPSSLSIAVFGVCVVSGVLAMIVFAWTAAQMHGSGYLDKMASD
ncbi:spinster family MFS transporter [Parerythrobacter jejuensis]|uniref:MFS transporter n=1 Tax=Parerythrobacter jejuensis TaxID=795812 RepID=A0A845AKR2_9SPHN|nr:MFS transporter [Parerythrobacter jejuensis]MXP30204.1 MFS transporter [Parerythrobacter jejuensis]MXP32964.1 MFS transporter [Parerythrobacter jejuensis]